MQSSVELVSNNWDYDLTSKIGAATVKNHVTGKDLASNQQRSRILAENPVGCGDIGVLTDDLRMNYLLGM